MPERHDQQGTGRHPHKDTQETWPHPKENEGRHNRSDDTRHAQSRDQGSKVGSSHPSGDRDRQHDRQEEADLKRREYRGEDGEIHHHTRAYTEQHRGESHSGSSREPAGSHSGGHGGGRRDR